jgi:hypothetical protein
VPGLRRECSLKTKGGTMPATAETDVIMSAGRDRRPLWIAAIPRGWASSRIAGIVN